MKNPTQDRLSEHFFEQKNETHGRKEHRRCWASTNLSSMSIAAGGQVTTVAAIQSDRVANGKGRSHIRYVISSKQMTAEEVLKATREYWGVENPLHWVLDISFGEDSCRAGQGYAVQNLAITRQIALGLTKTCCTRFFLVPMLRVGMQTDYHDLQTANNSIVPV